jgi:anthraniloyl-CoA monooxygenase
MDIVHRGTHVQIHSNHFSRTSRIDMLNILQRACLHAGAEIEFENRITDVAQVDWADLIVASDGANSAIRTQLSRHFQPSFETRRNKFA